MEVSYLLLSLPPTLLLWYGYGGGFVTFEIEIGDGPLTFILYIDVEKLLGGE